MTTVDLRPLRHTCTTCGDTHVCMDPNTAIAAASDENGSLIDAGRLVVDGARRLATFDGRALALKKREFDLLWSLARADGRVLTRAYLLDTVWADALGVLDRTVDVHIRRIRAQLESIDARLDGGAVIATVHGVGYRFDVPAAHWGLAAVA
jgi:DNA-binding response OmpR family regulator